MIYTDKKYLVADTLDELHKFARSIGLKKSEHFYQRNYGHCRCYYTYDGNGSLQKALNKKISIVNIRTIAALSSHLPTTDIYEGMIQEHLFRYFGNYQYKLCNTQVFSWESDFFAMSRESRYFIEAEIKISRSDFFVDFK